MRWQSTELPDVFVLEEESFPDERGYFARAFSQAAFEEKGITFRPRQASTAYNTSVGTLRGLHFAQGEAKLVRCVAGAVFDVAVDVRRGSPTFGQWVGTELRAGVQTAMFIPEGFAHGYQTLVDGSEVSYLISSEYDPAKGRGVRWDDPDVAVAWPACEARVISDRDRAWPSLKDLP